MSRAKHDARDYLGCMTRCPECGRRRSLVRRTLAPIGAVVIRYHQCRDRACRAWFKTIEDRSNS
jgi:hypothetical protein